MRVAVCLSGQARIFDKPWPSSRGPSYPPVKQNVVDRLIKSTNADVFCHFWDTVGPNMDPHKVCEEVNPKLVELEDQVHFNESLWDQIDFTTPEVDGTRFQHVHSMYYSIQKANYLKRRYEEEQGFTYDCVVRCRSDLYFDIDFPAHEFDPETIRVLNLDVFPTGQGCADLYAFGSSANMDAYSRCYEDLHAIILERKTLQAELILFEHVTRQNLRALPSTFTCSVVRVPRR